MYNIKCDFQLIKKSCGMTIDSQHVWAKVIFGWKSTRLPAAGCRHRFAQLHLNCKFCAFEIFPNLHTPFIDGIATTTVRRTDMREQCETIWSANAILPISEWALSILRNMERAVSTASILTEQKKIQRKKRIVCDSIWSIIPSIRYPITVSNNFRIKCELDEQFLFHLDSHLVGFTFSRFSV